MGWLTDLTNWLKEQLAALWDAFEEFLGDLIVDWAERDRVGAKKVGLKTFFARYGDLQDQQDVDADYKIDDIQELLTIVPETHPVPNKPAK